MRVTLGLIILALNGVATAQHPEFRVSANYVKVPVTVFDANGKLIAGLGRDDFQLFDEGQKRPIENFLLDKAPVNVLLLLDSSGSLRDELDEIQRAAFLFASSFGREDRISAISFADEVVVLQDWTNSRKALRKSLKRLKRGYRTALWDALAETVGRHFREVSGRRVIILLTDGLDNESSTEYETLLPELIRSATTLYIVSRTRLVQPRVRDSARVEFLNRVMRNLLRDDGDYVDIYFREKETAMKHLAESTGGRVLFPERLEELRASYQDVARELKLQYVLTFQPPAASEKRFRHIRVVCRREVGRLHYRMQYSWSVAVDEP